MVPTESGRPMNANDVPSSPGVRRLGAACSSPPPHASRAPLSSSTPTAVVSSQSGRPMNANDVSSSPGSRRLEAACSSPPPHASGPPLSSSSTPTPTAAVLPQSGDANDVSSSPGSRRPVPTAAVLPQSGHPMDANDVSSSPGSRRLEAAWSSPPPHASGPPLSSSSTPTADSPPPRTCTLLAEPSGSASREGNQDLVIEVHLVTREGFDAVEVMFQSSQTIHDVKEYFEKNRGKDVCSSENMVVYHDGTKLSNMTILKSIDFRTWNAILLTYEEDISEPNSNLAPPQEEMVDEDLLIYEFDLSPSAHPSTWSESDIVELATAVGDSPIVTADPALTTSETSPAVADTSVNTVSSPSAHPSTWSESDIALLATAVGETPIVISEPALTTSEMSPAVAETSANTVSSPSAHPSTWSESDIAELASAVGVIAEPALITSVTSAAVAETSASIVASSCSKVLIGRLLTPATPANFADKLLSHNQLHGFKTVHDLIKEINRGPPRWITKGQAVALLYNAEMFSVCDVQEDDKKDGLSCVIDSSKYQISDTLRGYSTVTNLESSEKLIGKMKEKGVEMDWFEVRGRLWSRRRLVLSGGDGLFHLLQWKQHQSTETTCAATRAVTQEPPHVNSDTATVASTPGETAQGEMRAFIQDFQTAVCSQLKEFQTTVSTQLSEFKSHIQNIETRVQAIEQERRSTPTMGITPEGGQSSSGSD